MTRPFPQAPWSSLLPESRSLFFGRFRYVSVPVSPAIRRSVRQRAFSFHERDRSPHDRFIFFRDSNFSVAHFNTTESVSMMDWMARGKYLSLLFAIHLACIIGAVALVAPLAGTEAPVQADRGTSTTSLDRSTAVVDPPTRDGRPGDEVRAPDAVAGAQGEGDFSDSVPPKKHAREGPGLREPAPGVPWRTHSRPGGITDP